MITLCGNALVMSHGVITRVGFPRRDWNGLPASCPQKRSSVGQGIRALGPRVRLTGSQERHLLRPWRATQARGQLGVTRFLLDGTEH